jgi:hypothetical protein
MIRGASASPASRTSRPRRGGSGFLRSLP